MALFVGLNNAVLLEMELIDVYLNFWTYCDTYRYFRHQQSLAEVMQVPWQGYRLRYELAAQLEDHAAVY